MSSPSPPSSPKRPRTDDELDATPTKKARTDAPILANLKAARDAALTAYNDAVRAVLCHPDYVRDVLPPVMVRRFLDTGRLTDVRVSVWPEEQADVKFSLDGHMYKYWAQYNSREGTWNHDINFWDDGDLEDIVHDPKPCTDEQLQTWLDAAVHGSLGQPVPMDMGLVEAGLIALVLVHSSDMDAKE